MHEHIFVLDTEIQQNFPAEWTLLSTLPYWVWVDASLASCVLRNRRSSTSSSQPASTRIENFLFIFICASPTYPPTLSPSRKCSFGTFAKELRTQASKPESSSVVLTSPALLPMWNAFCVLSRVLIARRAFRSQRTRTPAFAGVSISSAFFAKRAWICRAW